MYEITMHDLCRDLRVNKPNVYKCRLDEYDLLLLIEYLQILFTGSYQTFLASYDKSKFKDFRYRGLTFGRVELKISYVDL